MKLIDTFLCPLLSAYFLLVGTKVVLRGFTMPHQIETLVPIGFSLFQNEIS